MTVPYSAAFKRAWGSLRGLVPRRREMPAEPARPIARPYPWEASYPPGLDWDVRIEPRPLTAILDDAAARYPERPCLSFHRKQYRYKEVEALVAKAAKGLQDLGVREGTRVGLMLPNCPYYVIAYFAVLRAGGTVVNFNPLYARREIDRQIRDSDTRIMITLNLRTIYPKVADCLGDGPLRTIVVCRMGGVLRFTGKALLALARRKELSAIPRDEQHVRFDDVVDNDGGYEPAPTDPERDVAVLQYTGGTTGTPKGAMLTHANLYVNAEQTRMWGLGTSEGGEKVVGVLPLFHAFGMTGLMNVSMMMGAHLILLPRFKLKEVLKLIDQQKPSVFIGVPTMYSAIAGCRDLNRYDLSSLRYCLSGGAPLPQTVQRRFEEVSGCSLVEGYGLTEAGPVCTVNPLGEGNRPGSVGLPVPGTVVEVTDLEDPERTLGVGEHGEICIRGPQVMYGYLNQPEENAATLRDGRLHTGDVGYVDADGYVTIIDRIKDLILTGGFNVYPCMVEEAIYLHPAVEEAAVVGVPDRHRGETVKAYVKLREGAELTGPALREFLKDKLAPFEIPRQLEMRDELPKTLIGKISRKELQAEARRRSGNGADRRESVAQEAAH